MTVRSALESPKHIEFRGMMEVVSVIEKIKVIMMVQGMCVRVEVDI